MVEFEWDERKRESNHNKHKVDFLEAALIFEGPVLTKPDRRADYGEDRMVSLGKVDDECFVVVHTERNGIVRIISAWKGGRSEREKYEAGLARRAKENEG